MEEGGLNRRGLNRRGFKRPGGEPGASAGNPLKGVCRVMWIRSQTGRGERGGC